MLEEPDYCVPISVEDLAQRLDVTVQTIYRWTRGARVPRVVQSAIRTTIIGELVHPKWSGWHIDFETGKLWSPNNFSFHASQLEQFRVILQTNRRLFAIVREQRKHPAPIGGARVLKF